jgi:Family of unknown function (DUF6677)
MASFCKECGAALEGTGAIGSQPGLGRLLPFVLSVIPGLGHVYQGHPWRGIVWFFAVMIAYAMSHPLGFLLHLVCAANAALYATIGPGMLAKRARRRRRAERLSQPFGP